MIIHYFLKRFSGCHFNLYKLIFQNLNSFFNPNQLQFHPSKIVFYPSMKSHTHFRLLQRVLSSSTTSAIFIKDNIGFKIQAVVFIFQRAKYSVHLHHHAIYDCCLSLLDELEVCQLPTGFY